MAYLKLDERTGNWFVRFRYGGIQYKRSCRTKNETGAKRIQGLVDETIGLLQTGRLVVPDDIDPATWIVSGGKAEAIKIKQSNADGRFAPVCDAYFKAQHQKAKGTLQGEVIHIRRWKKFIREHTLLRTISLDDLQRYVDERLTCTYRGRPISGKTIRKELATFRQIWVWAQIRGIVKTNCPLLGPNGRWLVTLPKSVERHKFQTWTQIERRIDRNYLDDYEITRLWDGVYLDQAQIAGLLQHIKSHSVFRVVFPMVAFVAYTGCRRSEVTRAEIEDIDFDAQQIMIRERKRRKDMQGSTRFVPLHPTLETILRDWFDAHPGSHYAFPSPYRIQGSESNSVPRQIASEQVHSQFKNPLRGSKWEVLRGLHVLRHSFGSNLVRTGKVPASVVARWMGHTTTEMQELYQHLFPQDGVEQISVLG